VVRDRWSEVRDRTDLALPASFADELQLLLRHLPSAG
jgi:hypothetical protein